MTAGGSSSPQSGIPDALRAAVSTTLGIAGRAGSAALSRERGSELLDELARRGAEARDEIARRGGEARGELAQRGGGARDEVTRRLEALERRLGSIEDLLRNESKGKPEG